MVWLRIRIRRRLSRRFPETIPAWAAAGVYMVAKLEGGPAPGG